jgi:flagellum-specific peptidoglycan hydrolase FlgJ
VRDKTINFIEKYDMYLFAIWILLTFFISASGQTSKEVKTELDKYEIKDSHKNIIIAQSILETGWYKSLWCKNFNNIFGLTKRADTIRVAQNFTKWEYSVRSYYNQIYIKYEKLKPPKDYYTFLVNLPYAMDPEYINKLKKIVKKIEKDE